MKAFTFFAGLALALNSNAASLMDTFKSVQNQMIQKQTQRIQRKDGGGFFGPTSCTNFSGSWVGSCTVSSAEGDVVTPGKVNIIQDRCSTLKIDEETFNLGSLTTKQETTAFMALQTNTIYDWNKEATEVTVNMDMLVKVTLPQGAKANPAVGGHIYLENGNLFVELKAPEISGKCSYKLAQ